MSKYRKRNGSMVIEAAAGIMMLSAASVFAVTAHIENSKIIRKRILNEDVMRNIENIKSEIKYNITSSQLEELFKGDELGFKYSNDFGKNILDKELKDLEEGNDIVVKIISRDEEKVEFEVNSYIKIQDVDISISDRFHKSWWMDDEEV